MSYADSVAVDQHVLECEFGFIIKSSNNLALCSDCVDRKADMELHFYNADIFKSLIQFKLILSVKHTTYNMLVIKHTRLSQRKTYEKATSLKRTFNINPVYIYISLFPLSCQGLNYLLLTLVPHVLPKRFITNCNNFLFLKNIVWIPRRREY